MRLVFFIWCALVCVSCDHSSSENKVVSMQLIDRSGSVQTLNQEGKVRRFDTADFLAAQPYQKVTRTYGRDKEGKMKSIITTYHENGQVFQYLETVNGRACGTYREWHPAGGVRMLAKVIAGVGDVTPEAQKTWIFDSKSLVWDEEGKIIAEFLYDKGLLSGKALYFHKNGKIAKEIPYDKDLIKGAIQLFDEEGNLLGQTQFKEGKKDGFSYFLGNVHLPKREEKYESGKLLSGVYWNFDGSIMREIVDGCGFKPVFEKGILKKECEYRDGVPEGEIKVYRANGRLETRHIEKNGEKEGAEWFYYDVAQEEDHPKLQITWKEDAITGIVRTWHPNKQLQSEREMVDNQRNGLSIAWYEDGGLMYVEDYQKDKLMSGRYYQKGSDVPISKIHNGDGTATIYDAQGRFERKIEYHKSEPVD